MGPKSRFRGRTWLPRRLRAFFLSQWWRPAILSAILLAVITLQRMEYAVWLPTRPPQPNVTQNGWRRDQSIDREWFTNSRTGTHWTAAAPVSGQITCTNPYIIDGDTFDCGGVRIRLVGIDAPEMPGHCQPGRECTPGDPHAARSFLQSLIAGPVSCTRTDTDRYGRTVARCESGGRDLSCAMIFARHAVRRYAPISCPDPG